MQTPSDEKIGPRIIQTYRKFRSEKPSTIGYLIILMGYARCPFLDLERHLRNYLV